MIGSWEWHLNPWPPKEYFSPWLPTSYVWASGCHTSSNPWEGFCYLLPMTAQLRRPVTKSLRPRFYAKSSHNETVGMTSVEKNGSIDGTFMEVQHTPVFKSNLCPTAASTWRKGVCGGKNGLEVQGQARYTNDITSSCSSPDSILPPTAHIYVFRPQKTS